MVVVHERSSLMKQVRQPGAALVLSVFLYQAGGSSGGRTRWRLVLNYSVLIAWLGQLVPMRHGKTNQGEFCIQFSLHLR